MGKSEKIEPIVKENGPTTFTKEQILMSFKFKDRRDLLSVILEDDRVYTPDEVAGVIVKFMGRKVT